TKGHVQRLAQGVVDSLALPGKLVMADRVLDDEDKLVAVETGQECRFRLQGVEAPGYLEEYLIAGQLAKDLVDRLEAVNVDAGDGDRCSSLMGGFERCPELAIEMTAIGNAGQCIEIGEAMIFLQEALGFQLAQRHRIARGSQGSKVPVIAHENEG